MKIGLITIHYANSYGGTLQAFSTQVLLSRFGDVSIINYKSSHLEKTMQLIRLGTNARSLLWALKDIFRLLPRYRLLKKFESFGRSYFKLTDSFKNMDQMNTLEQSFDVFVTGSDQIWNPSVTGVLDPAYYLDFINKKTKISFASSSGSYLFTQKEQNYLKEKLESFSHISVRESDTAQFLSNLLGNRSVYHVLDPTLMLTKKEWLNHFDLEPHKTAKKYILVYTLKKDSLVREVVKKVSKFLAIDVIAIDQDPFLGYPVGKHLMDASPRDFVELTSGAAFIVTNSFHGTAFAVNFGIPFLTVRPKTGLNRIAGFLESVGLNQRLIKNTDNLEEILNTTILYEDAWRKLNIERNASLTYLENAFHNMAG